MRISFLIPSYNHSEYIGYTLDSIFADAGSLDYEIIIIDDGSIDESKLIIESWRNLHPKVDVKVTYRENRGLCATLNELAHQASGEIIRLCASDDAIYLGSSQKIINFFEGSSALVLVGDALVIDSFSNVTCHSAITLNGGEIIKMRTTEGLRQEIVSNWSIPGPCFAMRRQVYDIVGYYSEDLLIEDWDFFLRVVALCEIQFVDGYFSYYRIHGLNACKTTDVVRRIQNISSQRTAAIRRLPLFNGLLRLMLLWEKTLLGLKIVYLKSCALFIKGY